MIFGFSNSLHLPSILSIIKQYKYNYAEDKRADDSQNFNPRM